MSTDTIKNIIIGEKNTFILKDNGDMFVSGDNKYWQLGLNDNENRSLFTKSNIINIDKIYSFPKHTLLRLKDGNILASGLNIYLQFGSDATLTNYRFEEVGLNNTKDLFASEESTYIIGEDDTLITSGSNNRGQLGLGGHLDIYENKEFEISTLKNIKDIIVGYDCNYAFAITKENLLFATGGNEFGQLGTSDNCDRYSFVKVFEHVKKVIPKRDFSLVLTYNDEVYFAGNNKRLNIGFEKSFIFEFSKIDTQKIGKIKDIYANDNIILLQTYNDELYALGNDMYNQVSSKKIIIDKLTKLDFSNNIDKLILTDRSILILSNNDLYINGEFLFNKYDTNFKIFRKDVNDFYANYNKIFFIDTNNYLFAVGRNNYGDLGVGTYNPYIDKPTLVDFI